MPKFSFIVPVYNSEEYLNKCIDSILNQTFSDFELIIVNDGSTDNSSKIIESYAKKDNRVKYFYKDNGGISDARNFGVSRVNGEYIIFVDSDDYIKQDLLFRLNEEIKKEPNLDIIKYEFLYVRDGNLINENFTTEYKKDNGENIFLYLINQKRPFDMLCIYAFRTEYFKKNKFIFPKGKAHEDFALIPLIIMRSKTVLIINEPFYYYVQTNSSITRGNKLEKIKNRLNDMLYHYDNLLEEFNKLKPSEQLGINFRSYISNALIIRAKELSGKDLKLYINELKKRKVFDNLISNTLIRKTKKNLLKLFPKIFIKVV